MTDTGATLLRAIEAQPGDELAWLALADWLDERGQEGAAELTRLQTGLRLDPGGADRHGREVRLRALLASGVRPCVPVVTNSLGMQLALIPPGAFWMGSAGGEAPRYAPVEQPRHRVVISRAFYLGVHPVTQAQYEAVMATNPSRFEVFAAVGVSGLPVDSVSWLDAVAFCERLSRRPAEREAGRLYRLPTEGEWEYACRAGTTTAFHFGETLSSHQANFDGARPYGNVPRGPFLGRTSAVGSYPPNAFGLHDMHGNLWEWCHDGGRAYPPGGSAALDPEGLTTGGRRVVRGGSWESPGRDCRSARRNFRLIEHGVMDLGFRVACVVK
jgi:formylglycine-generating enzyme